jgi:RimJ/RimL family protein N-acetyltransferase
MFKIAKVGQDSLELTREILGRIYDENPAYWPNGLTPEHFDGGLYLIRESSTGSPVGFCGWQERREFRPATKAAGRWDPLFRNLGCQQIKVGYYSIGVLPEFRNNGFAKEALQKLIAQKSAGVDQVRAMIVETNKPSLHLADALGVEKLVKKASAFLDRFDTDAFPWRRRERSAMPEVIAGGVGAGLPLASLHQYHSRDLPALRQVFEQARPMGIDSLLRKVQHGDFMFDGIGEAADKVLGGFGGMAQQFQGSTPFHASMIGDNRKIYTGLKKNRFASYSSGGGHSYATDAFGRVMESAMDVGLDPRSPMRTVRKFRKALDDRAASELAYRQRLAHGVETPDSLHDAYKGKNTATKRHVTLGMRFPGGVPANQVEAVAQIMDIMHRSPYSSRKAVTAGLLNVLLPRKLRELLPGRPGVPTSSMCGELPCRVISQLGGKPKLHPGLSLPIDHMTSGELKPFGFSVKGLKAKEMRPFVQNLLNDVAKNRTKLGLMAALGLGGTAAGAVSLRRLREE